MHLALIIDDYLPHSTRVGAKMFHELALELKAQGHEVTVITPMFDKLSRNFSEDEIDSIKVWRFYSGQIKNVGKFQRAINETFLSFRAWKAIRKKIDGVHFDGIIYYSPSIFFGSLVKKLKKYYCCPAYLVLRDLFPQWVIDSGMIRSGSLIDKYFRFFEHYSYAQADMIGLMSERNIEVFNQITSNSYPTQLMRNWASPSPPVLKGGCHSIREKLNLQGKVIFFYGGNIGHAQDMANLMRLTRAMTSYRKAHFLYIGQGDEVDLITQLAKEWQLTNFTYLSSINQDEFTRVLKEIDVGLFSLSAKHTAHNFPGKLLGYMAESKPILGSVNNGNDLMELINCSSAGAIFVNGEDEKLLSSAKELCDNQSLRIQLGQNSRALLYSEFATSRAAAKIVSELKGNTSEKFR
ncbi:glycosyltransferase family 4 protein [Vibrio coralliilyticus]|uniref:glycosyltransferase family 4 protein n=1 Tax=Vibrio coralliilyticus TaxID=190893 RepID=UPI003916F693